MWRGIQACFLRKASPFSKGPQKDLDKRTRTSFTLGPCDVDNVEFVDIGSLRSQYMCSASACAGKSTEWPIS